MNKEFLIIEKYIRPLCKNSFSLNLRDDVAVIPKNDSTNYVISKDGMTESIHFPPNYSPKFLAKRLLRSNLSDIASSGGTPKFYMLFTSFPKNTSQSYIKSFYAQLKQENKKFNINLIGGDSITNDNGKITLSLTIIGEIEKNKGLFRFNAKVGDDIYVTGNVGKGFLGLKAVEGKIEGKKVFLDAFNNFLPPITFASQLAKNNLSACAIDISDGFLADLTHILKESKKSAIINLQQIPLLKDSLKFASIEELLSGGDDYEIIFTAPQQNQEQIQKLAKYNKIKLTKVGKIVASKKFNHSLKVIDKNNKEISFKNKGYVHL